MTCSRSILGPAAPLLVAVTLVASACGTDTGIAEPPAGCSSASACPPAAGACLVATCVSGQCGTAPVAAGTAVPGGAAGDCSRSVCDGAGQVVAAVDDLDLPADGNACTFDRCSGGVASNPAAPAGTACAQDGGTRCDGEGLCVQCLAAADCPGTDTECSARTCSSGVCGVTSAPLGTALAAQTPGDCRQAVCDGFGGTTTAPLDTDLPVDDNACTQDRCSGGVPSHPPVAAGMTCSAPGRGTMCDGAGACVQCLTASTCPGQDGVCAWRTCVGGACGVAYQGYGVGIPDPEQAAGDCRLIVCDGSGGTVSIRWDADVPVDGNACTTDSCADGVTSNPPAPAGTACAQSGGTVCDGAGACVACNTGADCASRVCASHVCQAPTCTDLVKNGDETDVDCGGTVCPKCAPPLACVVDADCTTGICHDTLLTCQNPSCYDGLKNGDETDVDCGGSCSRDCARGQACLANADCTSGNCAAGTCTGPVVTGTLPADSATDAPPATAITIFFGRPVSSSSITVQGSSGTCSGSVQLSADDFATCVAISGKLVAADGYSAAIQPAAPLAPGTSYRVRTTTALSDSALGAFEPFETATGFTVAAAACSGKLVVSQVYPGGGLTNAAYAKDYVELHNNGPVPAELDGMAVWYAAVNTTSWTVTPLAGTVPPGGYYLVQMAGGGTTGAPLPTPDATGTSSLSSAGGTVVLVSTPVVPPSYTVSCPTVGVLDTVGWGGSSTTPTSCREGAAPAPAPSDNGAALVRVGSGCGDGNGNSLEFVSALAVPRSSASAPVLCGCNGTPANETGLTIEMDWCNVQFPGSLTAATGTTAGPVYGRVFELTITDPAGAPAVLTSQLGYGPAGTDPRYAAGWSFVPATWNAQFGNDDEFQAFFTAPAVGSYAYAYRFSPDGQRWTYCDPNGAGSSAGAVFEPNALPTLTVTP